MKVHLSSLTLQKFPLLSKIKIEVKIEDEDQTLLLLCSLLSSYKSFRKAIIYGGKSTIKVNEVKEHLLNKKKINNQLTGKSHLMFPGKFTFQRRRVIMKVSWVIQNTRI